MQKKLPDNLLALAKACPKPLYIVGGFVRDYLAGMQAKHSDLDICSPLSAQDFAEIAAQNGFIVQSVYKHTGTVKLSSNDGNDYEYSCFRSDKYVRGEHTPAEIFFTEDISLDAKRRDFTANAVYYDIVADRFVDPLNGIDDIAHKRLNTVAPAEKVFGEDGLRLLRLARQAAQLQFTPTQPCMDGAKRNADLICDISPERIYTELTAILSADEKYGVANAPYRGLKILEESGVLSYVLPEIQAGKGIAQRADFHKYDVLEHSFKAVAYAHPSVRLAALLHDVGKPYCYLQDGNFYQHHSEGERLVREILRRLKAPKKTVEETALLTRLHMYDMDGTMRDNKLRRFFIEYYGILPKLLLLKQADYSACTDDTGLAPTCKRWQALLDTMQAEKVPFSLRQLKITGDEVAQLGCPPPYIAKILHGLLLHVACNPADNENARLKKLSAGVYKSLQTQNE